MLVLILFDFRVADGRGEPNVPTEPEQLTKNLQVAAPIGSKITFNSLSSVSCCQNVAPDVAVPKKG